MLYWEMRRIEDMGTNQENTYSLSKHREKSSPLQMGVLQWANMIRGREVRCDAGTVMDEKVVEEKEPWRISQNRPRECRRNEYYERKPGASIGTGRSDEQEREEALWKMAAMRKVGR